MYVYIVYWNLPGSTAKTTITKQRPRPKMGPLEYRAGTW